MSKLTRPRRIIPYVASGEWLPVTADAYLHRYRNWVISGEVRDRRRERWCGGYRAAPTQWRAVQMAACVAVGQDGAGGSA